MIMIDVLILTVVADKIIKSKDVSFSWNSTQGSMFGLFHSHSHELKSFNTLGSWELKLYYMDTT